MYKLPQKGPYQYSEMKFTEVTGETNKIFRLANVRLVNKWLGAFTCSNFHHFIFMNKQSHSHSLR